MADALVTQVERSPTKQKPRLEENEAGSKEKMSVDTEADATVVLDENDITPRSGLGRMFSRQFTPTIVKSGFGLSNLLGSKSKRRGKEDIEVATERLRDLSIDEEDNVSPEERHFESSGLLGRNPTKLKHCLVLDLDETLVHSSFKPVPRCDFILSINLDGVIHKVYVLKRPGCDEFLEEMSKYYELVIFTASLDKYANPLLDLLDPKKLITARLYREHCSRRGQMYIKDLDRLGRRLDRTLIIDNSAHSYALHPGHAVPILSWFDDMQDTELLDMVPFLRNLTTVPDVSDFLDANKPWRTMERKLSRALDEE